MVKKILEEKYISIPEVKEAIDFIVEQIKQKDIKINIDPFTENTMLYVNTFSKMSAESARKIIAMLEKEYSMDKKLAIQVVNINPSYGQELIPVFDKDPVLRGLSEDDRTIMIQQIKEFQ